MANTTSKSEEEGEDKVVSLSKDITSKVTKLLQDEVLDLRQNLAKFINGIKNLKRILKDRRHPNDKSGIGYDRGKNLRKKKSTSKCLKCRGNRHTSFDCRDRPKKTSSNISRTNHKGSKQIWVTKKGKIYGIYKVGKHPFPFIENLLFVEVRNPNGSLMFTAKTQNNLYKINMFNLTNQNLEINLKAKQASPLNRTSKASV
ncbi:hypothetical protein CR513_01832, partial [Mucuna pruriens]